MSDARAKWAVAFFGSSTYDMRQTSEQDVSIRALAIFGSVRVMVPPGSRVELSGFSLLGSRHIEVGADPTTDGPLVKLRAWAFFGDVKVV